MGPQSLLVEIITYKWLSQLFKNDSAILFYFIVLSFLKCPLSLCILLTYPQATFKQPMPKKTATIQYPLTMCIFMSKTNLNNFLKLLKKYLRICEIANLITLQIRKFANLSAI
jgi:hypothetical protein